MCLTTLHTYNSYPIAAKLGTQLDLVKTQAEIEGELCESYRDQ